jgi:nitrate reductase cytochrome c-type subunit
MINTLCGQCHNLTDTSVISAPRTDPVWFRFQALTLTWSRCYVESAEKLNCVTCHDPHRDADRSVERNEAKCLSCHAAGTGATVCSVNPSRGCIECHMPRAWLESTHSYKTDHFIRVRDRDSDSERKRISSVP